MSRPAWAAALLPLALAGKEGRNVLFFMADQHRHDAMGKGAHTPHLDSLAAEGAQFTAHYTSTPSCTPARAAILTGLSPWRHGMLGYGDVAPKYARELPVEMVASGRETMVIGKDHFGWNASGPIGHGFEFLQIYDGLGSGFNVKGQEYDDYDRWFQKQRPGENPLKSGGLNWNTWRGSHYEYPEELHPTAWTGRKAVAALKKFAEEKKPFFLKVSFHRPHSPYDPPERILEATQAPEKLPARAADGWDKGWAECANRGAPDHCCGAVDQESLDLARRAYRGSVAFVDEQIGRILATLKETGLADDTVILYTSDHGDMQNDHFLWRKSYPYEGSAHVPLLFWWPKSMEGEISAARGSKIDAVTELRDVFPTFLDVIGHWDQKAEAHFDGRPLTQLLRGAQGRRVWRGWLDLEHNVYCSPYFHWNALTDGKMKFIFHAFDGEKQLFNLTADPEETVDLAKDPRMSDLLELWRGRMVEQFRREKRGQRWVDAAGRLKHRRMPCNYCENFPLPVHNCKIVRDEERVFVL